MPLCLWVCVFDGACVRACVSQCVCSYPVRRTYTPRARCGGTTKPGSAWPGPGVADRSAPLPPAVVGKSDAGGGSGRSRGA